MYFESLVDCYLELFSNFEKLLRPFSVVIFFLEKLIGVCRLFEMGNYRQFSRIDVDEI